ncbi:DUF1302 domain-containing protein [Denitromonas ohlonensis]|nr:DUF1302 family protein [Denitromonas ohlonensis]
MRRSSVLHCRRGRYLAMIAAPVSAMCVSATASAFTFDTSPEWRVNLDNSVQYTLGARMQSRDNRLGNHPFYAQGNYKFDNGDVVTNRIQDLVEFQAVYRDRMGFRVSGSLWNDFAYDDRVETNPNPAFSTFLSYPSGRYSSDTKKYHLQGGELLDAFVFNNTEIGGKPVYLKAGRLTQFWGNALFFGFSSISYSQSPVDYIKGFSQPGSEVKELFLPRAQILGTVELTPELSISGQYFFEWRPNRYPEGGTYLGPFDILYRGPTSGGALAGSLGGPVSAGNEDKPSDNNQNFGVKVTWSPEWAGGDLGFYYRQLDEVHPWALADISATGGGRLHLSYAQKVKLFGLSYERSFGLLSTGFEASYRQDTALNSALTNGIPGVPTTEGATGDVVNVIANAFVQLGSTPFYDSGVLLAELSYTHLVKVTGNESMYNGVGHSACRDSVNSALSGDKWDGCATNNAVGFAMLFEPQWLQVFPSVDISMPVSYTRGVKGNPAYAAGSFYAEGAEIYSVGVKATYKSKHSIALQYNGYHWRTGDVVDIPGLGRSYAGYGGNGAVALNDKGWLQLTIKSSF